MKAVRCRHGKAHVTEVPRPTGDGVRVKVASAGICGSDLHLLAAGIPLPATLGHEIAGITANGIPVAIEPIVACGACAPCLGGDYHLCVLGAFQTTIGVGRDGGMAEELIVPERCLVPLPSGLKIADACLVEPLAVAVHGLLLAGLASRQRVAVVGGGSIGQCTVAAARAATDDVFLLARHDAQKVAGERLGAALEADGEYDIVVDGAGTAASLADAVRLAKPGATLVLLATYWEGMTVPGFELKSKELRLIAASSYCRHGMVRDVDVAAALLGRNPVIAEAIITHRLPLDAAEEAFAIAGDRAAGAIKVALLP